MTAMAARPEPRPARRDHRHHLRVGAVAAVALALAVVGTACGGGSGPERADPDDLAVQVASYDLAAGRPGRFIVGLLTLDQRLVGFGTVDMRFSYIGTKEGVDPSPPGPTVTGRYLPVPGSTEPSPAPDAPQIVRSSDTRGVYAAQTAFDRPGFWEVEVRAVIDGKARSGTGAFAVNAKPSLPAPGDQALATENLTLTTPDTPRAAVDSRGGSGEVPDPGLHRSTIAAALAAGRPIVAVFATPVYCTSRFCGPVTDMIEELSREYADRATFVHVEIWRDFQTSAVNKSAADWLLRDNELNEPWVFLIGSDGRIVARYDNVATRAEVEPFLRALPIIGPDPA